jgi:hypothetical protein
MQWVKVSERLPTKRHNYHVKISAKVYGLEEYNYNSARLFNGEYFEAEGYPEKKENVIEWLDEAGQQSQQEAVEFLDWAFEYSESGEEKSGHQKTMSTTFILPPQSFMNYSNKLKYEYRTTFDSPLPCHC